MRALTITLSLSLFLLLIPSICSLNCSIARESTTCSMLPSCSYRNNSCAGTFPDPYPNITSFYIDPVNGSDIHPGSIERPFKTLENAFNALRGKDGALAILNHRGYQPIEITSQITINSSITLKTLFEDLTFTIDLQRFDVSKKSAFKIQQGGNLSIYKGKFDSAISPKGLETVFDIEDNARLSFNNVSLWSNSIPVTIVRSTGQNSNFDYSQGSYWNSSFTFDLQGGRHDISKVRFDEIKSSRAIFSLNHASLTINNITVKKGGSLFIHMADESALEVQNLTLSNYNGSFLYAQDPSFINVNYSSFRDVRLTSPNPFIHITGTKIQTQFVHLFNQTRFWDIYLQSSLILVDKMLTSIAMENVNMNRVLQENRGYPKGICLAAENEVSVSIQKSVFAGINTTCLDLDSSSLRLESNIFDNSWSSGLEKQASGSRGITWVSLNGGTNSVGSGFLVKILSNSFKENKFAPMNGGALRFTGSFPGTVIIKNNSFTGNQAIASGGAIYSDNIDQNFEIEDNLFTNNYAHVAGAIYIMNNRTSYEEEEEGSKVSLKGVKFIKNKSYQGPVMVVTRTQRFSEENCVYEGNEELQKAEKRFILDEL